MPDSDIEIQVWSNFDYEKLIAEIYYKGQYVALINQDDGLENLKIELPGADDDGELVLREIDLSVFEEALELARRELAK